MRSKMMAQLISDGCTLKCIVWIGTSDGHFPNPGIPCRNIRAGFIYFSVLGFPIRFCSRKNFGQLFAQVHRCWWFFLDTGKNMAAVANSEYSLRRAVEIFFALGVPLCYLMLPCAQAHYA